MDKAKFKDKITKAIIRIRKEKEDFQVLLRKQAEEAGERKKAAYYWLRNTRPATKQEYMHWLGGYLKAGGDITHVYDYDFPLESFVTACADFTLTPLYGNSAKCIIVPEGITCVNPDMDGHNDLYFMKGFTHDADFVPMYKNISADSLFDA